MAHGLPLIRREHGHLTLAVLFTCLDWGFAMISLWLCFKAVGQGAEKAVSCAKMRS